MASCEEDVNVSDSFGDLDSTSLSDFIKRYNIPQTVIATQALSHVLPAGGTVTVNTGDVLLLRAVTTGSVTLSFYDADTAYTRDVHLPVNFPGRFEVVIGKYGKSNPSSSQKCGPDPEHTDNPYENYEGQMYERVEDLVRDCPPFFKSTEPFVDPINSKVNFCAGDRFRFVSIVCDGSGRKFLECKHMSGRLMRLPGYCRGQFQALQDKCYYTLSDLVSMGPVSRRLRLAKDSLNGMYPIPGLKRDYSGDIHMHKPISYVQVSPWNNLEVSWNIPCTVNLQIKHYAVDEYETPVSHFDANRYTLTQFRIAYEDNFPVLACIQSYTGKPNVFAKCLPQRSPIVCIHSYDKVEKILARSGEEHYALCPHLQTPCLRLPRSFTCVSELLRTEPGTKVMIKETIACDIPAPFCLKDGDLLCISAKTSFTVVSVDYKWNHSSHQVNVLKCERVSSKKGTQRIKIPLDLEVRMEEVFDGDSRQPVPFGDFLQTKPELPVTVEFTEPPYPSVPQEMTLCNSIRDPCLLLSARPSRARHKYPDLENVMLEIPERHMALLSFEKLLKAEDVEIGSPRIVCQAVESISSRLFTELESSDRAYETISGRNLALPKKIPFRRKPPKSRPTSLIALSSALSKSMPSLNALRHRKKNKPLTATDSDLDLASPELPPRPEDANLYEDVELRPIPGAVLDKAPTTRPTFSSMKLSMRRSFFKKKSQDS